MQRLFIATHLPEHIASLVEQRQNALRAHLGAAQEALCWTPTAQFHLTLAFLGQLPVGSVPAIADVLAEHCHSLHAQPLRICKCGYFSRRGIPTVLWCRVITSPQLDEWCAALRQSLQPLCPEMDTKDFHPHLTLARLKSGRSISRAVLQELFEHNSLCSGTELSWNCNQISLVKSDHCCRGAVHSVLSTHQLK